MSDDAGGGGGRLLKIIVSYFPKYLAPSINNNDSFLEKAIETIIQLKLKVVVGVCNYGIFLANIFK